MAIEFRCSQCGRLLRTGDDTAGRLAQCPECGGQTRVPTPDTIAQPSFPAAADSGGPYLAPGPEPSTARGDWKAYQSPGGPGTGPSYSGNVLYASKRVSAPAVCLIVISVLSLVFGALNILADIFKVGAVAMDDFKNIMPVMFIGPVLIFSHVVGIIVDIIVLIGAIKMLRLQTYWLAMTASILALIPCIAPCCIMGLPFGIWALVVLSDPVVRMSFKN
jgi:hypothetical protein